MFFYLSLAIAVAFLTELSIKTKVQIVRVISFLIIITLPSFFYAIRYGIGTDYYSYIFIFEEAKNKFDSRIEWGYYGINYLVGGLGSNVEVAFFIVSVIMFTFIFLSLKESKQFISPGIGMFVFMLFYYQMSFNISRQVIAMSILLFSLKYVESRKFIKFIFFIILASSFHISSLVFFPIYFLYSIIIEYNKKAYKYVLYLLVLLIVFNLDKLFIPIINNFNDLEYYSKYLQREDTNFDVGFLIRNLPLIVIGFYVLKKNGLKHKKYNLYFSLFIISIFLNFTSFLGTQYISRIALMYGIIVVILIPYMIKLLNSRKEVFLSWLLLCYIVFHWWYIYIYVGSHGTYPYQWIY